MRAVFDDAAGGWIAHVGEQNLNEQRGHWQLLEQDGGTRVFLSAAACLGEAVATIIAEVDREAENAPSAVGGDLPREAAPQINPRAAERAEK